MKVLLVSYYFPPQNVISAIRVGKLAKYLSGYGWEPWVLTLQDGIFPSAGALPIEIPEKRVIRADLGKLATLLVVRRQSAGEIKTTQPKVRGSTNIPPAPLSQKWKQDVWRWFSAQFTDVRFPDRAIPWVLPAVIKGRTLLQRKSFQAIFSSHGPPSSHIVASILAAQFGIPWVADYRDLWSNNHILCRREPFQWIETQIERWILKKACALTTVSLPLAVQLEQLHHKRVTVIPNGFDEEDYWYTPSDGEKKPFTIVYTGMIYPGKRDPSIIFQAVRQLIDTARFKPDAIEIHFYGSDKSLLKKLAQQHRVEDRIHLFSRIPNQDAIRKQTEADMLLLLEWSDPSAKGVYTGKVFEYLGARRPIMATGPAGGVIESLLAETQSGRLVVDAEAAARMIVRWAKIKQSVGTTRLSPDSERLNPYKRRWQAGQLAAVLTRAVGLKHAVS